MNKKLILAAIAVALTASCAQATNITGVTGNNGVYNIKPEHYSGNAGYRKYTNFTLDKGDVANLEFIRSGKANPDTFVNLVDNKVNVNGILNTTRNGAFYNGHAVFITPSGFVVGSSGVLNVGRLSVATPTAKKYKELTDEYEKTTAQYQKIGQQISKLTQNSTGEAGAADITIQGKVFARNGVEMTGKNVNISGAVVNGISNDYSKVLTTEDQANAMFNALVNTDGLMPKSAGDNETYQNKFVQNGSRILIKSTSGMNVSGSVANGAGNVYLTNNGINGLGVSGAVDADKLARVYNTKGELAVSGNAVIQGRNDAVVVQNKGDNLTLGKNTTLKSFNNIEVINQGSGRLTSLGTVDAGNNPNAGGGHIAMINKGSGMTVDGTISNNILSAKKGETAITNHSGDLSMNGSIENNGNIGIINYGSGAVIGKNAEIQNEGKIKIANTGANGLTVVGKVNNNGEIRIYNDNGRLKFGTDSANTTAADISNKNGKLYVASRKDATGVEMASKASIVNENGNIVIRNSGTKTAEGTRGTDLQGTIKTSNGTIAINNDFGDMYVSGNIATEKGNAGIINRKNGGEMVLASNGKVNVQNGNLNIKNFGTGDMTVNSEISHNGRVNVLANAGALQLGAKVHNNSGKLSDNGGFYAAARAKGTGVNVTSEFAVDGNGEVLIKNITGENGLRYNGTINTTNNQAALVNKKGNMEILGKMTTTKAPIIISNQGNGMKVYNSTVLNSGTEGVLVNTGSESALIGTGGTYNNIKMYEQLKK